eukprot:CAMPEP_0185747738 /NCGR_PEP_ID=MMETSP1174-20130828/6376_1 /TAXON_ID=35687 /ORGANISM="Dictyocha speculum, Strain CCMP1381" /LENGTH=354 /DNA_ID=CAMNT_0028423059 /DNA_START=20 /DNA_END=1084 /DNA_ORIENTATION=+
MSREGRRMTPKGQMSGNGAGPPIAHLPPMMKAMFEPRGPIEHKPPLVKRKMPPYHGMAHLKGLFETVERNEPRGHYETPKERKARVHESIMNLNKEKLQMAIENYDPHKPDRPELVTSDAYKTLFVARLSFDSTERKLRREFEQFGPIKMLRLVMDKTAENKPRGYAFIEYERDGDMREAYKRSDGRKIDGRRIVVDVERGRTVRKWRPRRFGGGLGQTRKGGKDENVTVSGRASAGPSGGGSSRGGGGDRDRYESSRSSGGGGGDRDRGRPERRDDRDRYGPSSRDSRGGGGDRGNDRYGPPRGGPSDRPTGGNDRDRDRGRDGGRDGGRDENRDRGESSRTRDRSRSRDRRR